MTPKWYVRTWGTEGENWSERGTLDIVEEKWKWEGGIQDFQETEHPWQFGEPWAWSLRWNLKLILREERTPCHRLCLSWFFFFFSSVEGGCLMILGITFICLKWSYEVRGWHKYVAHDVSWIPSNSGIENKELEAETSTAEYVLYDSILVLLIAPGAWEQTGLQISSILAIPGTNFWL